MNMRMVSAITILVAVFGIATPAWSVPLTIIATPTETTGSFRHNLLHSSTINNGQGGATLAWLNLDTSQTSTWDPDTGALTLYLELFSDIAQTASVGFATATSGNLLGANLSAPDTQDGGQIGNISWDFDAAALAFLQSIDASIADNTNQAFVDHKYADTTTLGYQPNSYASGAVTLWGADAAAQIGTGPKFDTALTTLGADLVFEVVVPVPAAVWLLGSALGLLGWMRRSR